MSAAEGKWDGIAASVASVSLAAVAIAAILSGYDCMYVTVMVVGIAGLGGFTYRRYVVNGGRHADR